MTMRGGASLAVVGLFVLSSSTALGAVHVVSPKGGAQGQSGADWDHACKGFTGSCAPSSLVRGDIYYVGGGSYPAVTLDTATSGSARITIRGATAVDHGPAAGFVSALSVSTAEGGQQATFASLTLGSSDWLVDGVVGAGAAGANASQNYGFGIHNDALGLPGVAVFLQANIGDVTLSHLEVDGVHWDVPADNGASNGFYVTPGGGCLDFSSGATFDHLYVHDLKGSAWLGGGNTTIQYSVIARVRSTPTWHGEGVASRTDCATGNADHSVFRYNTWQDVLGTGAIVALYGTARSWEVYGNVFVSTGATCTNCNPMGPTVLDNTGSGYIAGLKFYNNTVYGTQGKCGAYSTNTTGATAQFDIKNNLFYHCMGGIQLREDSVDYNSYFDSYVYFCDGTGVCPGPHDDYACAGVTNCPAAYAKTPPAAAALFASPSSFDFHPLGASIDGHALAGTSLGAPYGVDMDGVARTTWTRGAFEFCDAGCVHADAGSATSDAGTNSSDSGSFDGGAAPVDSASAGSGACGCREGASLGGGAAAPWLLFVGAMVARAVRRRQARD